MISLAGRRMLSVAVVLALLAMSCGDDDSTTTSTTSAPTSIATTTTTTTTVDDPATEALAVYEADWAATDAAFTSSPVDPDLPALLEVRTGRALSGVQNTLRTMLERQHRYSEVSTERDPEVVAASADRVEISDCVHEISTVVSVVDGSVVEEVDHTSRVTAVIERLDGSWKVASFTSEGVDSCD